MTQNMIFIFFPSILHESHYNNVLLKRTQPNNQPSPLQFVVVVVPFLNKGIWGFFWCFSRCPAPPSSPHLSQGQTGPTRTPALSSLPQTRVGTVRASAAGWHRCGWGVHAWVGHGARVGACTQGCGCALCEHTRGLPAGESCVPTGARPGWLCRLWSAHSGQGERRTHGWGVSHTRVGSVAHTGGERPRVDFGVRAHGGAQVEVCARHWERTRGGCGVTHGWLSQCGCRGVLPCPAPPAQPRHPGDIGGAGAASPSAEDARGLFRFCE